MFGNGRCLNRSCCILAHDFSVIDAGRNDRHTHNTFKRVIACRAEDHIRIRINFFTNTCGSFINFIKCKIRTASDRDQETARARHIHVIKQRIGNGSFGSAKGALLASGFTRTHHRLTHLTHHSADIGEIEIDQAFFDHQIGDAGDT